MCNLPAMCAAYSAHSNFILLFIIQRSSCFLKLEILKTLFTKQMVFSAFPELQCRLMGNCLQNEWTLVWTQICHLNSNTAFCAIVAPDGENGYFPLCTKQVIKPWVPLRDIWSLKIPVFWADFPSTHCSQSVWDWLRSTVCCSSTHH